MHIWMFWDSIWSLDRGGIQPYPNKVHIGFEACPSGAWELTAQVILNGTAVTENPLKFTEDQEREFLTD